MIHLEDPQPRVRISVGKCVQTGAEDAVLPHAGGKRLPKADLRVVAAGYEEGSQGEGERLSHPCSGFSEVLGVVRTEDPHGQRILEDKWWRVVELVCRPTQGYAQGCPRWHRVMQFSLPCAPSSSQVPARCRVSGTFAERSHPESRAREGTRIAESLRVASGESSAR